MNALNEKQIQILQVAERLFAEKGFDDPLHETGTLIDSVTAKVERRGT